MKHAWERAAGMTLDDHQVKLLVRYREWLAGEGAQGGGIGPSELPRLDRRHLADSLAYARFLRSGSPVVDVGSGVGLPGIPLAIALPARQFQLNDRSGRRLDLLERAIRHLGLHNAVTLPGDITQLAESVHLAVARAVFQPRDWVAVATRILAPGGSCLVGVAAGSNTPAGDDGISVTRQEIGPEILDRATSFLTMTKRE